jgi:6-phosphogluconolactonase
MTTPEIKVFPDPTAVARAAADRIVRAADKAISATGRFTIALAGGSTPKMLYELLAANEYRDRIDWTKCEVYFGDERTVPPDHSESNYRMGKDALLCPVSIPPRNVHRMRGELDPQEAAKEYGQLLKGKFGDGWLDMVLLGMGDDGHTASLFPHTAAIDEPKHRCVANYVEKLNTWRITMTAPFINRASEVLILITGQGKAARVSEVLEGSRDPHRLPIQLIAPEHGSLTWLLDVPAAGTHEEHDA